MDEQKLSGNLKRELEYIRRYNSDSLLCVGNRGAFKHRKVLCKLGYLERADRNSSICFYRLTEKGRSEQL